MIRSIFMAAVLAVIWCMPALAQDMGQAPVMTSGYQYQVNIWGGYTTADMGDVNNILNAAAGQGGSATRINSGYTAEGDFLYELWPRLFGGVRLGYIGLNQGKASNALAEVKQDYYLVPIMAGGRYYFMPKENPWNLSGGLFAGVGLGYGKTNAAGIETKYDGTGFTGEVLVGGEYKLGYLVSIGLDVGYRYANVPQMNTSSGSSNGGTGGGGGGYSPLYMRKAAVTDAAGNTVKYDFSGLVANIGILFRY